MAAIEYNWQKSNIFSEDIPAERLAHDEVANKLPGPDPDEQQHTELIDIARRIYQRSRLQRRYRRSGAIF